MTHNEPNQTRDEQHRREREHSRVAAQPTNCALFVEWWEITHWRLHDRRRRARVSLGLQHIQERESHRRAGLSAGQAVALICHHRGTAVMALRGGILGWDLDRDDIHPNVPRT